MANSNTRELDPQAKPLLLNCDLGELPVPATGASIEERVMPLIDQASIACGGHAGDSDSMRRCVRLAQQHGVTIGAHPSYVDRAHFGRRSITLDSATLHTQVQQQIDALAQICAQEGAELRYVKPHGALYNDMCRDAAIRNTVMRAVAEYRPGLALMLFAGLDVTGAPLPILFEAFADRCYDDDGLLLSRSNPRALHDAEQTLAQVKSLRDSGSVITLSGRRLAIRADSLCVHGDNPAAADAIAQLRAQLEH